MRSERWKFVEQVLAAALNHAPEARPEFLARCCQGDDDLRREVETLITAYDQAGNFIDESLPANLATSCTQNRQTRDGHRFHPAPVSP